MSTSSRNVYRVPNGEVPGTFTNGLPNSNWICRQIAFKCPMPDVANRFVYFSNFCELDESFDESLHPQIQIEFPPLFFLILYFSGFIAIMFKQFVMLKALFLRISIYLVQDIKTTLLMWILMIFFLKIYLGKKSLLAEKFNFFKIGFCKYIQNPFFFFIK